MTDFDPYLDPHDHRPPDRGCVGLLIALTAGGFLWLLIGLAARAALS